MIFEADRHEELQGMQLDDQNVRRFAAEVLTDAVAAINAGVSLPGRNAHYEGPARLTHLYANLQEPPSWGLGVYSGLLGALWGAHYIERNGFAKTGLDYVGLGRELHQSFLTMPGRERSDCPFFGELGYLMFRSLVERDVVHMDRAFALIESGYRNDVDELFWGAPAFAAACLRFADIQPEPRWERLFREIANYLWHRLHVEPVTGAKMLCQNLDGVRVAHLGAAHGFAGAAGILLQGAQLLSPALRDEIVRVSRETLERSALRDGDFLNWPQSVGGSRPGRTAMLMQWCHGSPGIITSMYRSAAYPTDHLLEAAAVSTWHAGPLAKARGGLCHGTAGNGYAFLTAHKRAVQGPWLERARAYAAHAMVRSRAERSAHGSFKVALWTGDVGTAVYAVDCLLESPGLLTLDKL